MKKTALCILVCISVWGTGLKKPCEDNLDCNGYIEEDSLLEQAQSKVFSVMKPYIKNLRLFLAACHDESIRQKYNAYGEATQKFHEGLASKEECLLLQSALNLAVNSYYDNFCHERLIKNSVTEFYCTLDTIPKKYVNNQVNDFLEAYGQLYNDLIAEAETKVLKDKRIALGLEIDEIRPITEGLTLDQRLLLAEINALCQSRWTRQSACLYLINFVLERKKLLKKCRCIVNDLNDNEDEYGKSVVRFVF
jgi:hypothetical protein